MVRSIGSIAARTEPTTYELTGGLEADISKIVLTRTEDAGWSAAVTFIKPRHTTLLRGDVIEAQRSRIGTLVTLTIDAEPDFQTVTLTVPVPDINMGGAAPSSTEASAPPPGTVSFETPAIKTTIRDSIVGPGLLHGVIQSYGVVPMQGLASRKGSADKAVADLAPG